MTQIQGSVQYADLDGNTEDRDGRKKFYADVKIVSNVELPLQTAVEIGWAVLAKHDGRDRNTLEGMLPRATPFEIKPPWQRGWPQYLISYRDNNSN